MQPTLSVVDVSVRHGRGTALVTALDEARISFHSATSTALVGPSGSGKTTLAEVILGLRRPVGGSVLLDGRLWVDSRSGPRRRYRHLVQGVPQDAAAALPPWWSIRRTIIDALRRLAPGRSRDSALEAACERAGLDRELLDLRPSQMSGGQAQRAAIARALAVGPAVLVADEPTSALDPATSSMVGAALVSLAASHGVTVIIATHDAELAERCDRVVAVRAGRISLTKGTS